MSASPTAPCWPRPATKPWPRSRSPAGWRAAPPSPPAPRWKAAPKCWPTWGAPTSASTATPRSPARQRPPPCR
ncbi:hypothetical protein IP80_20070 [beta proteobacterium AAP65]|nr:hypothetical protein IP80_20070 [beta proteobacterium AAP65]